MAGARTQSFAVALYDFTARDENELSLIAGDELTILLCKPGRQWLLVLNLRNRHDGWVPSNYIRETNTINVAEYGADFLLNAYDEKVQEIKESIGTNSRKGPSLSNQTKPSNESLVECNTTYWSHSQLGDVEIPEICVYSIEKQCKFENIGCKRLHSNWPSYWQMKYNGSWINLRSFQSRELEISFQDPANSECRITPFDMNLLEPSAVPLFLILQTNIWEANFDTMTISNYLNRLTRDIRRLSSPSAAVSEHSKATVFKWYFSDINNKWTTYEHIDGTGSVNLYPNVFSSVIERHFVIDGKSIFKFKNANFEYELDFSKMIQRNLTTGKERRVRRRPQQNRKEIDVLPDHWDPMDKSDVMTTVLLSHSQKEYDDIERLITSAEIANSTVFSINRIQNPSNWLPLRKKMVELLRKYGSVEKINMQTLFHGTKSDNISNICKDNFNWRLAGTNAGHLYGKGAYFSNSAKYSHDYSTSDPNGHRFMIVTRVIVGSITKGDQSMSKPPLDPSTGMLYDTSVDNVNNPKIFVKYDETEYYPIYVIEYTTNSTPSNITVKSSDSPSHEWFFCDDSAEWERCENSDDIEKSYNNNKLLPYKFVRSNYEYELDFLKMIQKNHNTSKEREVKRKQKVIIVSASEPKVLLESASEPKVLLESASEPKVLLESASIPKIKKKKCCVIQ